MDNETIKTPPVKVGDIVKDQVTINLGKRGEGVVKYDGYIIFVSGSTKIGETVSFKITKTLPSFGIAELIE